MTTTKRAAVLQRKLSAAVRALYKAREATNAASMQLANAAQEILDELGPGAAQPAAVGNRKTAAPAKEVPATKQAVAAGKAKPVKPAKAAKSPKAEKKIARSEGVAQSKSKQPKRKANQAA